MHIAHTYTLPTSGTESPGQHRSFDQGNVVSSAEHSIFSEQAVRHVMHGAAAPTQKGVSANAQHVLALKRSSSMQELPDVTPCLPCAGMVSRCCDTG